MKKITLLILTAFLIITCLTNALAQEYRLGGSAIYNFKTKGVGIGLRAEFPLESIDILEGISIVPQVSYFPAFNTVSEFYLGSSVHLGVYKIRKWIFYALINTSYKGWINYDESNDEDAKFSNLALEGGIGVTRHTCLRPFLELRLNAIGLEPNIRIGLLYTIHCDIKGAVPCPKIPQQPTFD